MIVLLETETTYSSQAPGFIVLLETETTYSSQAPGFTPSFKVGVHVPHLFSVLWGFLCFFCLHSVSLDCPFLTVPLKVYYISNEMYNFFIIQCSI